jgi:patatin-like phospholipase/acyl hydrolase
MDLTRPLRVLVMDGGGVRGLSEILMLKDLMQRLQFQEEEAMQRPKGGPLPQPWKYFDLICGTSTGGLLAIMLGRLRMVKFTVNLHY